MAKKRKIRIMLAGGGSAGHLNPLLAVYSAIKEIKEEKSLKIKVTYIGNPGRYAKKFKEEGIPVKTILPSKLRRYFSFKNLFEFPKFFVSFLQSLWHIFWEMPDILMSKGGPGSLAPVIAARFFFIPVVIHESDAIPSITTKISSFFSKKIFLSFEDAKKELSSSKQKRCEFVGNPLRKSLLENLPEKREAKIKLGFNPDKLLMVIMGGSQGSQRINNLITASLLDLLKLDVQVFHQTGVNLFNEVSGVVGHYFDSLEEMKESGYRITDFFDNNIKNVLAAADIIVSRAGSSIFEFAALGKPSILIPLPESAQNHQLKNALSYERSGSCIVLEEDQISIPLFVETVEHIISEPGMLDRMSSAAREFSKPDAAIKIAEKLIKLANG
ncbi:MAG: UDP-N-acetylglucosamine--N-acetylmuramyl-(pentapeptide) pyrophosphoryl-undecaprenol N-acetylglucosamine transferase [Candidatus Colwellbacteria bacterium]|jgi:UDP-N-acetylglucosamine--N-acetylmuramyl-(pentapeptide) pyrophosphoryl-undecaprenol N-acetylglucosamine transferase|nr:UDP-N-acetylglucosamine--N-acetylmuramyl-(pentapeptide) pyrophosphoryl-undecaprenol N-acetylglucosamine transferase [Candidatus Colwellbacteria bacterium]MCK9497655.1 UDP-N-acetylglucosamine--N-acetylmuramyl-(pentapeptide) pyrophosphoryl-undecaprenol N-acetylglucosamine transferase [Candidatus Colwellbacteria bacterium]MDD3752807.1 UDP-N-acetylglucosamine--N-acetylmuramyl-(pentapeptide) pyrophosphoryl-undecaprenol N-acetylglucosamine transferase [Candidatus Colwellbacteria bacterium]MDD481892